MEQLPAIGLPAPLAEQAERAWANILERAPDSAGLQAHLQAGPAAAQLPRVLATSPFVADLCRRRPALLAEVLEGGFLQQSLDPAAFAAGLEEALARPGAELDPTLRRYRQRHMLRIVWRDFCRLADTAETIRDTSLLAEACIQQALESHRRRLEQRFGRPLGSRSGEHQQLIVLAMGKLGARELNVSSDIDLIFAYPEAGRTDHPDKPLENEQFFIRLGQALIASLDQVSAEGFVFRVDMRLRPYGESGALVHHFAALEAYYQDQGRDWERYALVKARPVSGDPARAAQLMQALRPFVYRRYVDFGVIESLRSMKAMISAEVRRRGLENDVKLGHGGIREVEFIAQCFQLIRGGRDVGLQQRELLPVLAECARVGCLPPKDVAQLRQAYLFLRDSEHAIQGYEDRQSQALPSAEIPRAAMALVMGFSDWDSYAAALKQHRQHVSEHFNELISAPEDEQEDGVATAPPWEACLHEDTLAELGFAQPEESLKRLISLRDSKRSLALQATARERLEQFMPQLLAACGAADDPDLTLQRILPLVVAVLRRSAYLVLLLENPQALEELVMLCAASPWIAEQMARTPVLLDELLDRSSLYQPPDRAELRDELRQQFMRLAEDDLEAQMDALRYFKASHVLRVAASELTGRLPLMKVSDNLSWIAEVILEQVLAMVWADLVRKHGEPQRQSSGYGFAIVGYGKLGGIELGHGSDLDLVFISDGVPKGSTSGPRVIDNAVFYTRLGQRIIHVLEARMAIGQLYETDMRLRPSGDSGMLVASLESFGRYQQESAWTWEHQALVRARVVAGDAEVGERFEALRREVLAQVREQQALALEVVKMRRRMSQHLLAGVNEATHFHLKQGSGGMVDIEFMVQYAVLAWSAEVPALARWSDNVRILEALAEAGLFSEEEAWQLTDAYLAYRSEAHRRSLQQQSAVIPVGQFRAERRAVQEKWKQLFGDLPQGESE